MKNRFIYKELININFLIIIGVTVFPFNSRPLKPCYQIFIGFLVSNNWCEWVLRDPLLANFINGAFWGRETGIQIKNIK